MLGTAAKLATALAATLLFLSGVGSAADVRPGKPAPDFKVKDANGTEHTLSQYKGKIVVLEWNNFECPYVQKHYTTGNMQALQAEAAAKGAIWLVVNSAPPGMGGYLHGLEAQKHLDDRKSRPTAYLIDDTSRIGRAYEAKSTPQMVVIGKDGTLAYIGAIDDRPTANPKDVDGARNYVREAITAVSEGKPVPTASTRPYGCSVKYRGS
jgi:hypothetical protein